MYPGSGWSLIVGVLCLGLGAQAWAASDAAQGTSPVPPAAAAKQGFVQPKLIPSSAMKNWPVYSQQARRQHREGVVLLALKISSDGAPLNVAVARSSKFADLDLAAVSAVRNWKFSPAQRDGIPVEATVTLPVNFSLKPEEKAAVAAPAANDVKPQSAQAAAKPKAVQKHSTKPAVPPETPQGAK